MYSVWTKHLKDQQEKTKYEQSLRHVRWVLERQNEILSEMEQDLNRSETNPKTYDIPNWDYRQAHNNGFRQCLNIIQKLNIIDQKDNNDRQHSITSAD